MTVILISLLFIYFKALTLLNLSFIKFFDGIKKSELLHINNFL